MKIKIKNRARTLAAAFLLTEGPPALAQSRVSSRSGPSEALMHNAVERLVDADMVAIAAYVASLQP
jgi:cytochrome c553